jgi:hypothetical protein
MSIKLQSSVSLHLQNKTKQNKTECFQQKKDKRVPLKFQSGNFCYIISNKLTHITSLSLSLSGCVSLIIPPSEFYKNLMIQSGVLFHTWHWYFISNNKWRYIFFFFLRSAIRIPSIPWADVLAVEWLVGNASSDTSPMWVQSHTSDWVWLLIFMRFLDHTQRRSTGGRTPLDERSASHRVLYLTTHNTNNTQTSMDPVGCEPTIPAGERPQTHALDRAATGTGQNFTAEKCSPFGFPVFLSKWIHESDCHAVWNKPHGTTRHGTARPAISPQSPQLTDRESFVDERAFRLPVGWWWHPSRQEPYGAVSKFGLLVSRISPQRPKHKPRWICGVQSDIIVNSAVGECHSIPPVCEVYPLLYCWCEPAEILE